MVCVCVWDLSMKEREEKEREISGDKDILGKGNNMCKIL